MLKEAGLVTDQRDGGRRVYELNPEGLGALRAYLDRFWYQALTALATAAEHRATEIQATENQAVEHEGDTT